MKRNGSYLTLIIILCLTGLTGTAQTLAASLTNGDFETGDFTGWTTFTTANGILGFGFPHVALFDTNGDGVATLSAQFRVGQVTFEGFGSTPRGGGIFQVFHTGVGLLSIQLDIASEASSSGNAQGGFFELLLDNVVISSHDFGEIAANQTKRATLGGSINISAGFHEIAIRVRRAFLQSSDTPRQYVDNVILSGSAVLDHFKCYRAEKRGRFEDLAVTLEDQFESKQTRVKRPVALCNPVDKNGEGIMDSTAHLVFYDIDDVRRPRQPQFEPRTVLVENQFGQQVLNLTRAESLGVPSEKDGVASSLDVDHFKCYDARGGERIDEEVTLEDQFEAKLTEVRRPVAFCTPVDKNEEGIKNPDTHLTCFDIRDSRTRPRQPRFQPLRVTVENQFDTVELTASRSDTLCVPSTMTELP